MIKERWEAPEQDFPPVRCFFRTLSGISPSDDLVCLLAYGHLLDPQSLLGSDSLTRRAQLPFLQNNGCPSNAEQNHGSDGPL
jgi:hypothetical protein